MGGINAEYMGKAAAEKAAALKAEAKKTAVEKAEAEKAVTGKTMSRKAEEDRKASTKDENKGSDNSSNTNTGAIGIAAAMVAGLAFYFYPTKSNTADKPNMLPVSETRETQEGGEVAHATM